MELASPAADPGSSIVEQWQQIQPSRSTQLGDARRQFHHAAQFATAAGISYLPPKPDDSHTNLEWLSEFRALFSRVIPGHVPFRIGVRPADLALLLIPQPAARLNLLDLNGCTISDATRWLKERIDALGGDSSRYTLKRHYEIPSHPVASGSAFDSSDRSSFAEVDRWFANGFSFFSDFARRTPGSSEVRCWPHHFDIGTLIANGPRHSIGVGLEPGDNYYDEPYFYLNMNPQPRVELARSRRLAAQGSWHTKDWIGAVLPGSRLRDGANQASQVREFFSSAVAAAREILRSN